MARYLLDADWAATAASLRDCFTGCEMTLTEHGAISRDAMCWSEIEMLSLKLLVRKICQLQPDKNVTIQAGGGNKNGGAIFRDEKKKTVTFLFVCPSVYTVQYLKRTHFKAQFLFCFFKIIGCFIITFCVSRPMTSQDSLRVKIIC